MMEANKLCCNHCSQIEERVERVQKSINGTRKFLGWVTAIVGIIGVIWLGCYADVGRNPPTLYGVLALTGIGCLIAIAAFIGIVVAGGLNDD